MAVRGVVREWHTDEGWGVLDLHGAQGGCWAHFSAAAVAGYVNFAAGDEVEAEFETPGQDGYEHRATRFWPAGAAPQPHVAEGPSGAYSSTLTLDFD
ncbi:cold shock domain-containing protein [Actinoplanes sp. NPDC051633]|uniref:cold shock domain-containing protein n=1 Tax=Actinoplanes sp. NPDC051633 TaxID=3155670 RepID=UPI0034468891